MQLGLEMTVASVKQILKYVDIGRSKNLGSDDIDSQHPLSPRLYSVSPFPGDSGQIRLTVGRHFYKDEHKKQFEGKASGYLIHTTSAIHIQRSPARQFYLPKDSKTPILMFAAGTGISPFMGFIEARIASSSGLNWLFFSTPTHTSFYYQDELGKAIAKDQLKLSVIFSRENINTAEFDRDEKHFHFNKKYMGKHVDTLIEENAEALAKLIQSGAHIYVCGNNDFAKCVRKSIKSALLAHGGIDSEAKCESYLDSLIADQAYHYDTFTPAISEQAPSKPMFRSDVVYHNKEDDCWMIINGCVYDLSRFVHEHPGGRKILHINAGVDASGDYNSAKHNENKQINALLMQHKVGILVDPKFQDAKTVEIYRKCILFLEGLLEMANTLSNSTTFTTKPIPLYLWREVLNILVNGHLNSYESHDNVGSLKYVFGKLFSQLNEELDITKDHYQTQLKQIFELAGECAEIIRTSSIGSSPEKIAKIETIAFELFNQTSKFIEAMKLIIISFTHKLEVSGEAPSKVQIAELIQNIEKIMRDYSEVLKTHQASLASFELRSSHSFFSAPASGGVCPFGFGKQQVARVTKQEDEKSQPLIAKLGSNGFFSRENIGKGATLLVGGLFIVNFGIDTTVGCIATYHLLKKLFNSNDSDHEVDHVSSVLRPK